MRTGLCVVIFAGAAFARAALGVPIAGASLAQAADHSGPAEDVVQVDDGVKLAYRSVGSGADVVVIPVAVLTSPHFDKLAQGRRLVYYDPRGRGKSDVGPLSAVSVDRATRDLEEMRRRLGIERMALIGFSGYGLEMAIYALAHPERVTRLVQLCPVPPRLEPFMSRRSAAILNKMDQAAS